MIIDLDVLNSNIQDKINIDSSITFDSDTLENSLMKNIEDVKFNGFISKDLSGEFYIKGNLSGVIILEDSISLELVNYPFSIEIEESIEENLENNQNSIDIIPILWQNIVLEVPLRYTEVKDFSSYNGDGWRLISEEEVKNNNNPFLELSKNFKEE